MSNLTMTNRAILINNAQQKHAELEHAIEALLKCGYTPAQIREFLLPHSKKIAEEMTEALIEARTLPVDTEPIEAEIVE